MENRLGPVTIFFTLMLCPMLMSIDMLGIGVALPGITRDFSINPESVHWLITLFAVGYVCFIVTASRLADVHGCKNVFLASVALFALSSLMVGVSHSFVFASVSRFLQGLSGGAMMMVVIALIAQMFEGDERKNKISLLVAMAGFGIAVGPVVGGVLVEAFSWRYIFFLNVPIALLVFVVGWARLPRLDSKRSRRGFDFFGIIFLTISLVAFAVVVSQAMDWGMFSPRSLLLHALWIASLIVFLIVESKCLDPLIRLSMFRLENFAIANIIGAVLYVALSAWIICSSMYFTKLHYTPLEMGLTFFPFGLVLIVMNAFIPYLNKKFNPKTLVLIGFILSALAFSWMAICLENAASFYLYCIGMGFFGISFVLVNSLSLPLSLEFVPAGELNVGSGIGMMSRWIGSSVSAPVMTSLFVYYLTQTTPAHALSNVFYILSAMFAVVFVVGLFSLKQKSPATA